MSSIQTKMILHPVPEFAHHSKNKETKNTRSVMYTAQELRGWIWLILPAWSKSIMSKFWGFGWKGKGEKKPTFEHTRKNQQQQKKRKSSGNDVCSLCPFAWIRNVFLPFNGAAKGWMEDFKIPLSCDLLSTKVSSAEQAGEMWAH